MMTKTIQSTTLVLMFTPPIVQDAENTSRAELKPCRVEMSGLENLVGDRLGQRGVQART